MGLLGAIRKNPAAGVVSAVIMLGAAGLIVSMQLSGRTSVGSGGSYYYDLKTGKLFTASSRGMMPTDAPEGGAGQGAVAHVFACGACTGDNLQVIAIETLSPEGQKVQQQLERDPQSVPPQTIAKVMASANLVALPPTAGSAPNWVVKSSAAGFDILARAQKLCAGQPGKPCVP